MALSTPNSMGPSGSSPMMQRLKKIVAGSALATLLAAGGGGGRLAYKINSIKKHTPEGHELALELESRLKHPTTVVGEDSTTLATFAGKGADYVSIEKLNPYLVATLIAVEDRRFWEHEGFDMRALVGMFREQRGGSTLASQLFKEGRTGNVRHDLDAKLTEWVKAKKLIQTDNIPIKWFVLEYYLNTTEFLANTNGIQAASYALFGKDQKTLSLDEAAMIVGMAQNPSRINPFSQLEERKQRAETRTDEVLGDLARAFREKNFPDFFQKKYPKLFNRTLEIDALIEKSTLKKVKKTKQLPPSKMNKLPWSTPELFRQADSIVAHEVQANDLQMGNSSLDTKTGGYELWTSIDAQLQTGVMEVVKKRGKHFDAQRRFPKYPLDMSVLIVDNATGAVLTDVRGRDFRRSELDFRAAPTELGSVIKAVVDAVALEQGIISSLEETYVDQPYTLLSDEYAGITDPAGWTPKNFGVYSNEVRTIGHASLIESRNTSIVRLFKQAALLGKGDEFMDALEDKLAQVGIHLPDRFDDNPQIGIGLNTGNLDQITQLYMAIARGGSFVPFQTLTRIKDDLGGLLFESLPKSSEGTSLYTPEVVQMIAPYLLEKGKLVTGSSHVLAKSGTTTHANQLWMVVCTPEVTLTIRMGPHDYMSKNKTPLGWGNKVDATGKLSPVVRDILRLCQTQGKVKNIPFTFEATLPPVSVSGAKDTLSTPSSDYFNSPEAREVEPLSGDTIQR